MTRLEEPGTKGQGDDERQRRASGEGSGAVRGYSGAVRRAPAADCSETRSLTPLPGSPMLTARRELSTDDGHVCDWVANAPEIGDEKIRWIDK